MCFHSIIIIIIIIIIITVTRIIITVQGRKKFRSDSPGLVDFVVGLVEFILHLPDGQVKVFREIFL